MDETIFELVVEAVRRERARQDGKWGGPRHDDSHSFTDWASFIRQRVLVETDDDGDPVVPGEPDQKKLLIEVAALAIAALESRARNAARAALR